jgi:protein-L-isoaspartate O-methyltransferase
MPDLQRQGISVNRIDFIPDVIWSRQTDGWRVPVNRHDDPGHWQELVDTSDAIITQVDEGNLRDGRGFQPSSSSSALDVMALMLELLDSHPGMSVLEIGAGTGYNAALIAQKVAPGDVTTIEIDPGIAEHARAALGKTNLPVTVVTGDGALGHADKAPYDRVMCTASALRVPYAWVKQTRPGGKIVLPVAGSFSQQAFACLTVDEDGRAQGRFQGGASFMRLRNQRDHKPLWRIVSPQAAARVNDEPGDIGVTTAEPVPPEPFTDADAAFAIGLLLPGWNAGRRPYDGVVLLSDRASDSWATVFPDDDGHRVYYQGSRRLWYDLDAAYRWWVAAGRPDSTHFGMTVAPEGQTFWLDSPDYAVPSIDELAG